MQKEDYQWVILALGILLVIALVIKPVVTHEEPNFGIPKLPELPPLMPPALLPAETTQPVTVVTTQTIIDTPATIPTSTPTPVPTTATVWNGSMQTVEFVDPSTYNINLTTYIPRYNELIPQFSNQSGNQTPFRVTNYTSILSKPITGQYSGTTQIIEIPFPYWELWYTVEPMSSDVRKQAEGSSYIIRPTQGEGASMSGFSGSYSTAMPTFTIDVVDADNPARIVRTVTPPGSLDPALWTTDTKTASGATVKASDPRPWKEKFFEGYRSYYFIIKASILKSYSIDIKVPNSYVGKL